MSTLNEIPQPPGKLNGKVAVITGGTTGIGLAAAKLFVREGAYVFITGRRQKELDEAVKEIGSNVTSVQGDVAKLADLDRLSRASNYSLMLAEHRSKSFASLACVARGKISAWETVLAPAIGGSMGNRVTQLPRTLDVRHAVRQRPVSQRLQRHSGTSLRAVRSDGYFPRYSSHTDRVHDWQA
jgi:short chain dehydrogenase